MPDSQALVKPYFVQLHSISKDGEKQKAYPFLVVHEGPSDAGSNQRWGWVFIGDPDNTIGGENGITGVQYLPDIGQGGPGQNVSWSEIDA